MENQKKRGYTYLEIGFGFFIGSVLWVGLLMIIIIQPPMYSDNDRCDVCDSLSSYLLKSENDSIVNEYCYFHAVTRYLLGPKDLSTKPLEVEIWNYIGWFSSIAIVTFIAHKTDYIQKVKKQ